MFSVQSWPNLVRLQYSSVLKSNQVWSRLDWKQKKIITRPRSSKDPFLKKCCLWLLRYPGNIPILYLTISHTLGLFCVICVYTIWNQDQNVIFLFWFMTLVHLFQAHGLKSPYFRHLRLWNEIPHLYAMHGCFKKKLTSQKEFVVERQEVLAYKLLSLLNFCCICTMTRVCLIIISWSLFLVFLSYDVSLGKKEAN